MKFPKITLSIALALLLTGQCFADSDTSWRKNWTPNSDWSNFPGEIGDAVYRSLNKDDKYGGAGHAAIVAGWNRENNRLEVIEASGYGKSVNQRAWADFAKTGEGYTFWGARTHPDGVSKEQRDSIVNLAKEWIGTWYCVEAAWEPPTIDLIKGAKPACVRCDGLVELLYESVGRNPCFFPPVGPQNQANELTKATYEYPNISNVSIKGGKASFVATDRTSGIDYVVYRIYESTKIGEPGRLISEKFTDAKKTNNDTWEINLDSDKNINQNKKSIYRLEITAFDKVHHPTIANRSINYFYDDKNLFLFANGNYVNPVQSKSIEYKSWDGSFWTAMVVGDKFVHAPSGDLSSKNAHESDVIAYITSDGNKWAAKIQNNQFLHAQNGNFSNNPHLDNILNYRNWDGDSMVVAFTSKPKN